MLTLLLFVVLMVLPSVAVSALSVRRGSRWRWIYALLAYAIGPLVIIVFLVCESFIHCPSCGTECAWNAPVCRSCLQPFPLKKSSWRERR